MSDDLVKRLTMRLQEIYDRPHDFSNGQKSEAAGLARDRIEELEATLAKAVEASYQLGMEAALTVIASIGYGKNEDVDCGHEEAFRAVEAHLADWKAATLAELNGTNQ